MTRAAVLAVWLASTGVALAQGESEHVAPDAPQSRVHAMPYRDMADMMGMDDRRRFGQVMLDRLEWQGGDESAFAFE